SIYDASGAWSTIRVIKRSLFSRVVPEIKTIAVSCILLPTFRLTESSIGTYLRSACLDVFVLHRCECPCVILNDSLRSQTPSKVLYWNDNEQRREQNTGS